MKWQEITVTIGQDAVEAVADVFHQLGSGGVVIEDSAQLEKMARSGQWDAYELPEGALEPSQPLVRGYLPDDDELLPKMESLKNQLALIMGRMGHAAPGTIAVQWVQEEDWANSWKQHFKPLPLGEHLVIKPTWENYIPAKDEIIIELDPGMAFGTGHHATTALCVKFLEKYVQPGCRAIDVGTGTGILAMYAAKLGANTVFAFDYDGVAVKVATENIALNHLDNKVTVKQNDLLNGVEEQADVMVANIIADIIMKLLPQVKACLSRGGLLLTSGVITDRREDVYRLALENGLELVDEAQEDGWVAQVWKVKG